MLVINKELTPGPLLKRLLVREPRSERENDGTKPAQPPRVDAKLPTTAITAARQRSSGTLGLVDREGGRKVEYRESLEGLCGQYNRLRRQQESAADIRI